MGLENHRRVREERSLHRVKIETILINARSVPNVIPNNFDSVIKLAEEVKQNDADQKKKYLEEHQSGFGYGGKYGVETDRMDKSAVGNDYNAPLYKHESQKDYKVGFGGSFGVQKDRIDKVSGKGLSFCQGELYINY